ncbi:hypothetical protein ACFPRL_34075 [Pseudoclavibacter helvolus]
MCVWCSTLPQSMTLRTRSLRFWRGARTPVGLSVMCVSSWTMRRRSSTCGPSATSTATASPAPHRAGNAPWSPRGGMP